MVYALSGMKQANVWRERRGGESGISRYGASLVFSCRLSVARHNCHNAIAYARHTGDALTINNTAKHSCANTGIHSRFGQTFDWNDPEVVAATSGTSEEKIVKNFAMKFLGLAIRPYRTSIRTRFTQGHRQFTVNAV
jgi:hypothetical protein